VWCDGRFVVAAQRCSISRWARAPAVILVGRRFCWPAPGGQRPQACWWVMTAILGDSGAGCFRTAGGVALGAKVRNMAVVEGGGIPPITFWGRGADAVRRSSRAARWQVLARAGFGGGWRSG